MTRLNIEIPQKLVDALASIAQQIHLKEEEIVCNALKAHLQDLEEDIEDYNDAMEILAQNNKTISWEEVQRKHGLLDS